ncbi:hypothetical protein [Sorangium sp. So ce204]|uniref:hypothetical protein n=1 Tax=Sorangium sp. So ce204 TaxID=3133288 RepID=UPI003F62B9DB
MLGTRATVHVDVDLPSEPARLHVPEGDDRRPQVPVDKHHRGGQLTSAVALRHFLDPDGNWVTGRGATDASPTAYHGKPPSVVLREV